MKHLRNGILATVIVGLGFIGAADARDFHRDGGRRGIETHQWHKADKHGAHAHADSRYQRHVERRRARQEHRIEEGWHSGQLTRKELKRLRKNQRRIAHMERKFLGDGYFSRRERRAMDEALDEASGRIYRKK